MVEISIPSRVEKRLTEQEEKRIEDLEEEIEQFKSNTQTNAPKKAREAAEGVERALNKTESLITQAEKGRVPTSQLAQLDQIVDSEVRNNVEQISGDIDDIESEKGRSLAKNVRQGLRNAISVDQAEKIASRDVRSDEFVEAAQSELEADKKENRLEKKRAESLADASQKELEEAGVLTGGEKPFQIREIREELRSEGVEAAVKERNQVLNREAQRLQEQENKRLSRTRETITGDASTEEKISALEERADIVGGAQAQRLDEAANNLNQRPSPDNRQRQVTVINAEGEVVRQSLDPQFFPRSQTESADRLTTEGILSEQRELDKRLVEGSERRTALNPAGLPEFAQTRDTVPGRTEVLTGKRPAVRKPGETAVQVGEAAEEIPGVRRLDQGVEVGTVLASDLANAPSGIRALTREAVERGPGEAAETVAEGLEQQGRAFSGSGAASEADSAEQAATRVGLGLSAATFAAGGALTGGRVAGVTGRFSDVKVRSPVTVDARDVSGGKPASIKLRSPVERVNVDEKPPASAFVPEESESITGDLETGARRRAEEIRPEELPELQQRVDEDVSVENLQPSSSRRDALVAADRGGEPLPRRQRGSGEAEEQELMEVEGVETDLETASPGEDEVDPVRTVVTDQGIIEIRESELGDTVDDAADLTDEQLIESGLTQQELEVLLEDDPGFADVRQATETGGVEEVFTPERRILASADVEPEDPGISLDDLRDVLGNTRRGEARLTPGIRPRTRTDNDIDFDVNVPDFRRRFADSEDDFSIDAFDSRRTSRRIRTRPVDELDDRNIPGRSAALVSSTSQEPQFGFAQNLGQEDVNIPGFVQQQDVELENRLDFEQDLDLGLGFGRSRTPDEDNLFRRLPDSRTPLPDRGSPGSTPGGGFGFPTPDIELPDKDRDALDTGEDVKDVDESASFRTSLAGLAGFGTEETTVTEEEAEGETLTGLEIRL